MSDTMNELTAFYFKPWVEFEKDAETIPVDAPPCVHCAFWKPQRKYVSWGERGSVFDGVVLCHSDGMHSDFSCFKPK